MHLEALLFDVDGTLAETEEIHRQAFNRAFAEAGLDWQWDRDRYRELLVVSGGRERIRHFVRAHGRALPSGADETALIDSLHRSKTRHYADIVGSGGMRLRSGVERLLREARACGLRRAIVTTTSAENLQPLIGSTLGGVVGDWFDVVCTATEAPIKKPAPDAYLWTLARLGLPGAACLALEDTANGVRAARAAGVPVLVTESMYSKGEDFTGALAVLSDLGEPDRPMQVRAGRVDAACVDVALLRRLHAAAVG